MAGNFIRLEWQKKAIFLCYREFLIKSFCYSIYCSSFTPFNGILQKLREFNVEQASLMIPRRLNATIHALFAPNKLFESQRDALRSEIKKTAGKKELTHLHEMFHAIEFILSELAQAIITPNKSVFNQILFDGICKNKTIPWKMAFILSA